MSIITEREETTAPAGETGTCEAIWTFIGAVCGRPAVGNFTGMCVHEHARPGRLCREHAETLEKGTCWACWNLPGDLSHECPISIAEVTT